MKFYKVYSEEYNEYITYLGTALFESRDEALAFIAHLESITGMRPVLHTFTATLEEAA